MAIKSALLGEKWECQQKIQVAKHVPALNFLKQNLQIQTFPLPTTLLTLTIELLLDQRMLFKYDASKVELVRSIASYI